MRGLNPIRAISAAALSAVGDEHPGAVDREAELGESLARLARGVDRPVAGFGPSYLIA